jgi:hypothetical protein
LRAAILCNDVLPARRESSIAASTGFCAGLVELVVKAAEVVGGLFGLFDDAAEDASVVDGLLGGAGEEAEVAGGLLDATISPAAWTMNEAWA